MMVSTRVVESCRSSALTLVPPNADPFSCSSRTNSDTLRQSSGSEPSHWQPVLPVIIRRASDETSHHDEAVQISADVSFCATVHSDLHFALLTENRVGRVVFSGGQAGVLSDVPFGLDPVTIAFASQCWKAAAERAASPTVEVGTAGSQLFLIPIKDELLRQLGTVDLPHSISESVNIIYGGDGPKKPTLPVNICRQDPQRTTNLTNFGDHYLLRVIHMRIAHKSCSSVLPTARPFPSRLVLSLSACGAPARRRSAPAGPPPR